MRNALEFFYFNDLLIVKELRYLFILFCLVVNEIGLSIYFSKSLYKRENLQHWQYSIIFAFLSLRKRPLFIIQLSYVNIFNCLIM